MDDIWDEDGSELDIIGRNSARFEGQIRTDAFRDGIEKVDSEKWAQNGFNKAFKETAEIFRPIGKLKK